MSDLFSKTGLASLALFTAGEVLTVENVSDCINRRVKATSEELLEAMNGKWSLEDRFLLEQSMTEYHLYQDLMTDLDKEIQAYINHHFPQEYRLLMTIPGVSERCTATVLAEIYPNVEVFQTDTHLHLGLGFVLVLMKVPGLRNHLTLHKEIATSSRI